MRAFVITAPGRGEVQEVPAPHPAPGQVIVDVERAGVCGTDTELFTGDMAYLASGDATYPLRIGHEWCGRVSEVGDDVDPSWLGLRVTGDTMLGCRACHLCRTGRQHLCVQRFEIGVRGGWPGALAEQLPVPATALVALPDSVDEVRGALVEPGGNALRTVQGAQVQSGSRLLVIGPGTIGLLVAQIARAHGVQVHLVGRSQRSRDFATSLGFEQVSTLEDLDRIFLHNPHRAEVDGGFDAVVDASNDPSAPSLAADLVAPGGRIVLVGLSGEPSVLDTRTLALKDVTAVGVLSASGGLQGTVDLYASGRVDPRSLVATTVGLDAVADVLAGTRPVGAGPGPKIHVDPRR